MTRTERSQQCPSESAGPALKLCSSSRRAMPPSDRMRAGERGAPTLMLGLQVLGEASLQPRGAPGPPTLASHPCQHFLPVPLSPGAGSSTCSLPSVHRLLVPWVISQAPASLTASPAAHILGPQGVQFLGQNPGFWMLHVAGNRYPWNPKLSSTSMFILFSQENVHLYPASSVLFLPRLKHKHPPRSHS